MTRVNIGYGTTGVGAYQETDVPNHLHNNSRWDKETQRASSTWKDLKASKPELKFLRSWHDIPLGWVTAMRAAKFEALINTEPVGYMLTGHNALIFPLYEVINVPF